MKRNGMTGCSMRPPGQYMASLARKRMATTGYNCQIADRKRGIVTDTLGLLLAATVPAAGVTENAVGLGITLEIVSRKSDKPGFHVVKRRRVVKRTIGWLMMHRPLARDYEATAESSQARYAKSPDEQPSGSVLEDEQLSGAYR